MSKKQHNDDASELWDYFKESIAWFKSVFIEYRKEMKGLPIGEWYSTYHDNEYDADQLEKIISKLMADDEVGNKKGIYEYIFTGNEKHLNVRSFTDNQKREVYEKQTGICTHCEKHFEIDVMEADHITPWSKGGKTISENCQMLCLYCNRTKGSK
jgi:5-methylcytosine-specific restriction endonuclease McrA